MKVGDRVETREGAGVLTREVNLVHDSRTWWEIDLDSKEDFQNPYHFPERDIILIAD